MVAEHSQGETQTDSENDSVVPPVPEVVVKRPRGRPRKIVVESDVPKEPKKKGRPRTLPVREPVEKIKMKTGPKTNLSSDKAYFTNYYKEHYHGVKVSCKFCGNPDIPVDKQLRHARSRKCMIDELFGKYKKPETVEDI